MYGMTKTKIDNNNNNNNSLISLQLTLSQSLIEQMIKEFQILLKIDLQNQWNIYSIWTRDQHKRKQKR